MRILENSVHAVAMEKTAESRELRKAIFDVASSLKFVKICVWRRCDSTWYRRVATMSHSRLRREFNFLLSQCGFRKIARLFKKFYKYNAVVTKFIGQFIEQLKVQDLAIFSEIMANYRFAEFCKYFSFLILRIREILLIIFYK